jgi:hypothetical protein
MHIQDGTTNDMPEDEEMENHEGWRPREMNKICCLEQMLLNVQSRGYISKHHYVLDVILRTPKCVWETHIWVSPCIKTYIEAHNVSSCKFRF